jgi:hypothetical protein
MRIVTTNQFVKRDLDRLIRNPRYGIKVEKLSEHSYRVSCNSLLDLGHCVPHLNDATATIHAGG